MTNLTQLSPREALWRELEGYKQMLDITNRCIAQSLSENPHYPVDVASMFKDFWGANVYFIAVMNDKQQIIESIIREECGLAQEEHHTTSIEEMLANAGDQKGEKQ